MTQKDKFRNDVISELRSFFIDNDLTFINFSAIGLSITPKVNADERILNISYKPNTDKFSVFVKDDDNNDCNFYLFDELETWCISDILDYIKENETDILDFEWED